MPPKKDVAAKGVKGKAKAVAKEEKKAQKVAKTTGKGKLRAHIYTHHTHHKYTHSLSICVFNIVNL